VFLRYRKRRKLLRSRATRVEDAPRKGVVKFVGRIAGATSALRSPLAGVPCALYTIDMREWDNGALYPFLRATSAEPLPVDDGSGTVWVYPSGAMFFLGDGRRRAGHSADNFDAVAAYAIQQGRNMTDDNSMPRSIQWEEKTLAIGDQIAVMGHVQWEIAREAAGSYRDMPQRLTLRSARRRPLLLTDEI
jgi:hypothetical protein